MSDIARQVRSERRRWARPGSVHDRVVQIAQVILPMGIGVLAAFLVMAPLFMGGDVSFLLDKNKVEVAQERMRTTSASYRGADANGQPFALTAASAVQQSSAEPIVRLDDLAAGIQLQDGPARMKAERGRYDIEQERVMVDGPIEFNAANGYRMDTRDVTVDLKTRQMQSAGPVTGSTPMGNFSGDRMRADLEERNVRLEGNARLRIYPGRTN